MKEEKEFELDDNAKSFIDIDDDYRLVMSSRNWQLAKKQVAGEKSKTAGEITYISFRYYTTLGSAIKDLIHIKLAESKFKTLQGFAEAQQKVINEISAALKPTYEISEVK